MQFLPYHSQIISERVNIQAIHLTRDIDRHIEERAKRKLERKNCCYGYVGHIHILSRSVGFYDSPHFNGEMTFQIEAVSDVCRPASGDEFLAIIVDVNKMGFLAKGRRPRRAAHLLCADTRGQRGLLRGPAHETSDPRHHQGVRLQVQPERRQDGRRGGTSSSFTIPTSSTTIVTSSWTSPGRRLRCRWA